MVVSMKNKLSVIMGGILGFIGILIGTSLVITYPILIKEFNVSLSNVQWLSSGYYLVATLVMSTTAYLMKTLPLKRIFQIASIIFIVGSLIAANAHVFWLLLVGCMLDAFATGLATPLMYQIVFHSIPVVEFGFYTGIVTMIKSFGPAFGPTYGGVLTHLWTWRLIFIGVIPLVIIALLVGNYALSLNKPIPQTKSFDFSGLLIFALMLLAFTWAINQAGKYHFVSINFGSFLIIGIILLVIFIYHLNHTQREYLNFSVLKNNLICIRGISFFNLQFVNLSLAFLLPLFAEETLHLNAMDAGLLLLPGALVGAIISPLAGKMYDHKGAFMTLMLANIFLLVGVGIYCILTAHLTALLLGSVYLIFRLGYTFSFGNTLSDASNHVAKNNRSDISSLFNTFQQSAGSLGNSLMATIISLYEMKYTNAANAVMHGSHFGLLILVVIVMINIIITIIAKQTNHQRVN